jgi:hypothetical protein
MSCAKLILSTMRHHKRSETDVKSSNAELSLRQTAACWALHYLSVIRKNKEKIVALGGLECIMNSLRFGLQVLSLLALLVEKYKY